MVGLELFGVLLVVVAIVYSFIKRKDTLGLTLIIVLLVLLFMLNLIGKINL